MYNFYTYLYYLHLLLFNVDSSQLFTDVNYIEIVFFHCLYFVFVHSHKNTNVLISLFVLKRNVCMLLIRSHSAFLKVALLINSSFDFQPEFVCSCCHFSTLNLILFCLIRFCQLYSVLYNIESESNI